MLAMFDDEAVREEKFYRTALGGLLSLPPIGPTPSLPGEERRAARNAALAAKLGRSPTAATTSDAKPTAKMRLICLYGMGGFAHSATEWVTRAPDWLEVRLIELPGHGTRDDEPLPFLPGSPTELAGLADGSCDLAQISAAREALVSQIVDDVLPLLRAGPTALFGFSNGAMLMFLLTLELQRRGEKPPVHLFVAARPAPHRIQMKEDELVRALALDDAGLIEWAYDFGVLVRGQPLPKPERLAPLLRSDFPIGSVEVGARPDGASSGDFAGGVARVEGAPLTALLSDGDLMWPAARHIERWGEVAGPLGFSAVTIKGVPHEHLMAHAQMRYAVIGELAVVSKRLLLAHP